MPTIGLVANVYNEANALPGWLETHAPFFDHIAIYHAGPQGQRSDDGTIELLEKWSVPITYGAIDAGFGSVRTNALRISPCDYVMLLDADERFFPVIRAMTCTGEATPQADVDKILQSYDFHDLKTTLPNWENVARLGANLRVSFEYGEVYNQGKLLRKLLEDRPDAFITVRRHWHDFSFKRPTQNWHTDPDWQMRLVKNDPRVHFDPAVRIHERLVGAESVQRTSLFFDHFHLHFKRMEQEQRAHDVAIYDAVHEGRAPPMKG